MTDGLSNLHARRVHAACAMNNHNHAPLPLDELDASTRAEMLSSFFSIVTLVSVSSFLSVCHALLRQTETVALQLMMQSPLARALAAALFQMGRQLCKRDYFFNYCLFLSQIYYILYMHVYIKLITFDVYVTF